MVALWDFTTLIDSKRRTRLLAFKSFDEVLRELLTTLRIVGYEAEPFRANRLRGCTRASFLLSVNYTSYDAFFNSPVGYRAQYCHSRETGERANRQMLNAIKPMLIEFAAPYLTATFGRERIISSLVAMDAKIWIDESESVAPSSNDFPMEIDYVPWVERAKRADALQEEDVIGAVRGVLAPLGTRLEVKGGWLDCKGLERRDPVKARRFNEIAINGFT